LLGGKKGKRHVEVRWVVPKGTKVGGGQRNKKLTLSLTNTAKGERVEERGRISCPEKPKQVKNEKKQLSVV